MESYDVIVIGAGQAGGPLATAFAKAGRRTALIEREYAGGTCVNVGCTPTKTMVASARVAYLARRGADYGVRTGSIEIDQAKVRQRKRDIVESFRAGSERGIRAGGAEYLEGEATFTGPRTLAVRFPSGESRHMTAPTIVINTGARPARPDVPGLANLPVLDSTSIMELDSVPEHLLVLGGGYIGIEFGQMFRRFGSHVSIVQRGVRLLSREDSDVADAVAEILRQDGIELLLGTTAVRATRAADGGIALTVRGHDGGERTLSGSHLLAAVGRVPNTERLNPAAAGITTNARGFIPVNDRLETNMPGIYAVGDVTGGAAFTHISYDDFRILRTNLIAGGDRSTTGRLVPYTVYMDPQLGRVGMSERQARDAGHDVKVAKMPMSHVARALEVDEPRGFMKAIVDARSGRILGAAVLGIEGGELMSMIEIAMMGNLPYTALRDGIFAHPTLAESLNNLFGTL